MDLVVCSRWHTPRHSLDNWEFLSESRVCRLLNANTCRRLCTCGRPRSVYGFFGSASSSDRPQCCGVAASGRGNYIEEAFVEVRGASLEQVRSVTMYLCVCASFCLFLCILCLCLVALRDNGQAAIIFSLFANQLHCRHNHTHTYDVRLTA